MKLDLSSFKKAVKSLERAIVRSKNEPNDEELRDAVIQRFEYTYELSWKMMKRWLEQVSPNPSDVDRLSYRDMIREAAEKGILANIEDWFEYRDQRNLTTHTYNEEEAKSVYQTALKFHDEAKRLLKELEKRTNA